MGTDERVLRQVFFEVDPHTGYHKEVIIETRPDGEHSKSTVLLIPKELFTRSARDILLRTPLASDGRPPDLQSVMLEAARALAADGSTKGHAEAMDWFLHHLDEALAVAAELKNKRYYSIKSEPQPDQWIGVGHAQPGANIRAFDAVRKSITQSVKRLGAIEGADERGRADWSPLAKRQARDASKDAMKHEPLDPDTSRDRRGQTDRSRNGIREIPEPATIRSLDLEGLADALELDAEERAYLDCYGKTSIAEMPVLMSTETGQSWDARRVDRVRKRIRYRWDEIASAAPKHLVWFSYNGTMVKVKTPEYPSGTWAHALLLHLFTR
jgi:hypothetical protein